MDTEEELILNKEHGGVNVAQDMNYANAVTELMAVLSANDSEAQAQNQRQATKNFLDGNVQSTQPAKKLTKKERERQATEEFLNSKANQIRGMIFSPDFVDDDGIYDTDDIKYRKPVEWNSEVARREINPEETYDVRYHATPMEKIGYGVENVILQNALLGDKAVMHFAGLTSRLTGGELGTELRNRSYEALLANDNWMANYDTYDDMADSWYTKIAGGATSMLYMMGLSMATRGIGPLVEMGTDALGTGEYNNMRKYFEENGTIDGYVGDWGDLAIDMLNACAQVATERLGFGSARWAKGATGHIAKEAIEGFFQESSQEFMGDVAEVMKGNEELGILIQNWYNYLTSGAIGGVLQGAAGGAIHKTGRIKADRTAMKIVHSIRKAQDPKYNENDPKNIREAQEIAKEINDKAERGLIVDAMDELFMRADTNNDRGKVREHIVNELTKLEVSRLELKNAEDLTPEQLADIQDAATIMARESVRLSWAQNIPIMETLPAIMDAYKNSLRVRDFKDSERGIPVLRTEDINAMRARMAEEERQMSDLLQRQQLGGRTQAERVQTIKARKQSPEAQARKFDNEKDLAILRESTTPKNASDQKKLIQKRAEFFRQWLENQGFKPDNLDRSKGLDDSVSSYFFLNTSTNLDENGKEIRIRVSNHDNNMSGVINLRVDDSTVEALNKLKKALQRLGVRDVSESVRQSSLREIAKGNRTKAWRGFYNPKYQEIILNKNADISTILHASAHMWLNTYFKAARSENAPKEFKKWWSKVERALGIRPDDTFIDKRISEKFARSFEKFIMDGGKGASETMRPVYERLSKKLADIYDDLATKYFDMVGELKPEVQGWFAQNEKFADSLVVDTPQDRAKERADAMKQVEREEKIASGVQGSLETISDVLAEQPAGQVNPYETGRTFERKLSVRENKQFGTPIEMAKQEDQKAMLQYAEKVVQTAEGVEFALQALQTKDDTGLIGEARKGSWYNALINKAKATGDANLLFRIQAAGFKPQATEMGRNVSALRNYTQGDGEIDAIKAIDSIENLYTKLSIKEQAQLTDAINQAKSLIEKYDKISDTKLGKVLQALLECKL